MTAKGKLGGRPAQQQRLLGRWLKERELDAGLPDASSVAGTSAGAGLYEPAPAAARSAPIPSAPAVGDIRLLPPVAGTRAADRPVYVAVLETAVADGFRVAPFGRYSVPGLPGEWRTGLHASSLRVLCLWNARRMAGEVLRFSWRAGRLRAARLRTAQDLLRDLRAGRAPYAARPGALGPPVLHPLDPRLAYEAEEAMAFEEIVRALSRAAPAGAAVLYPLIDRVGDGELPMAAESPEEYGAPGESGDTDAEDRRV